MLVNGQSWMPDRTASRFTRHQGRDFARRNVRGQLVVNVGKANHRHALKSVLRLFNRYPRAPIGRLTLQSPQTHCRSVRRDARGNNRLVRRSLVPVPGFFSQEGEDRTSCVRRCSGACCPQLIIGPFTADNGLPMLPSAPQDVAWHQPRWSNRCRIEPRSDRSASSLSGFLPQRGYAR